MKKFLFLSLSLFSFSALAQDLKVTASVLSDQAYVGQQVIYQASLLDYGGILSGQILPPELDGAEVLKIGNDLMVVSVDESGTPYQEIISRFAIFPSKSGQVQITPAMFKGAISTVRPKLAYDPFGQNESVDKIYDGLESGRQLVSVSADPISLNVLPKPAEVSGWWLPALDVEMTQIFMPDQTEVKAGEAMTRTIQIQAIGVLSAQIPDIQMPEVPGFKVYQGQPVRDNGYDGQTVIGLFEKSFVLMPVQGGAWTIPPLSLAWFDTSAQKVEKAVVPGLSVKVVGDMTPQNIQLPKNPYEMENSWLFFLSGIGIGLILVAGVLFLSRKKSKSKPIADLYRH